MNNTWIPLRHNSLNNVFHTFSIVFFETLEYLLSLPDTVALKSRVCVSGVRGSSIWFQRDLKNNLVKARTAKIHGAESLGRKLWCQIFRRRRTGVRWRGHVRRLLHLFYLNVLFHFIFLLLSLIKRVFLKVYSTELLHHEYLRSVSKRWILGPSFRPTDSQCLWGNPGNLILDNFSKWFLNIVTFKNQHIRVWFGLKVHIFF